MPEPMDDDRRCTATSKQSGERCKRFPVPGLTVCVMHGGKTPAAQAKAAETLQQEKAEKELRKLWVGLRDANPVADPVASIARLAGALEVMLDQVGETVNEIKTTAAGANLSQVRGEIVLLERIASLLGRTLDSMARLGLEERRIELAQAQSDLVASAFRDALAAVAGSVLPADRNEMLRVFLVRIGRGPAELEAGQVRS